MNDIEISSSALDHHGLVAGAIHELKIAERINRRIQHTDPRCVVTTGTSVVAMILNGLGFSNRRLYTVGQFFQNKPINELLGTKGLTPDHLNDDTLGRALDRVFEYGVAKLFCEVSFEILLEHKLFGPFARIDTTTISVEGEYKNSVANEVGVVHVAHGHSKDLRSDLKQLTVLLGVCGPANLPFFLDPLSGNESDKVSLPGSIEKVKSFYAQLGEAPLFTWVADSALYSKAGLLHTHYQTPWITRVPETINDAVILIEKTEEELSWKIIDENYKIHTEYSMLGGISQRWVLVFSQKAYEREKKTFNRHIEKEKSAFEKQLRQLSKTEFNCEHDARSAYEKLCLVYPLFSSKIDIKSVEKEAKRGKPKQGQEALPVVFKATPHDIVVDPDRYKEQLSHKGRFVLATNQLNQEILPDQMILQEYKGQNKVERGFAFLKDPWFLVDSIFLKNSKRITALTMIMTLCLLVYNYMTYKCRKTLTDNKQTIPNQVGKPIQNPTPKWLFQCMEGIAVVHTVIGDTQKSAVTNLTQLRRQIISLFGPQAQKIYGVT